MSKPILYMDVFDWLENQFYIVGQMLYEFNEIDFYVVERIFIPNKKIFVDYRKIHITGGVNGNKLYSSRDTKATSKTEVF